MTPEQSPDGPAEQTPASGNRWEPPSAETTPTEPPGQEIPAASATRARLRDRQDATPRCSTKAVAAAATVLVVAGVGGAGFAVGRATGHHDGFEGRFPGGPRDAGLDPLQGGRPPQGGQLPQGVDPRGDDGSSSDESGSSLRSASPTWYVVPWPGSGGVAA